MPSSFPTSLDILANPTAADTKDSATVPHAGQHANANDAIEALEAKVGVDGSAVTTSLDYLAKVALPKGLLVAPASVTANQTGITSLTDLTGLSVTATVDANRRIRLVLDVNILSSVGGDTATVYITDASNVVIDKASLLLSAFDLPVQVVAHLAPSAGSKTYKARMERRSGTGSLSLIASSDQPATLSFEDVGKA